MFVPRGAADLEMLSDFVRQNDRAGHYDASLTLASNNADTCSLCALAKNNHKQHKASMLFLLTCTQHVACKGSSMTLGMRMAVCRPRLQQLSWCWLRHMLGIGATSLCRDASRHKAATMQLPLTAPSTSVMMVSSLLGIPARCVCVSVPVAVPPLPVVVCHWFWTSARTGDNAH